MTARLQAWFAKQSLTVKILVVLPVLALALLWSTAPADQRTSDAGTNSNRPVLASNAQDPAPGPANVASSEAVAQPAKPTLTPHREPRPAESDLSWSTLLRTVVSVAVVVALVVLSARFLKRFVEVSGQPAGTSRSVNVVETTYLPAPSGRGRSAIHLVEVADRLLLVGATDAQLSLLAEFDRDDAPRGGAPAPALQPNGTDGVFAQELVAAVAAKAESAPARVEDVSRHRGPARSQAAIERLSLGRQAPADGGLDEVLRRLQETKRRLEG